MSWETLYNFVVYNQTNISECEKYTRIDLLRSNTHDITRKKNGFLHTKPLYYDTHAFQKRNV
jgi:hypothetical protein